MCQVAEDSHGSNERTSESASGDSGSESSRPLSPGLASTQYYYFYQGRVNVPLLLFVHCGAQLSLTQKPSIFMASHNRCEHCNKPIGPWNKFICTQANYDWLWFSKWHQRAHEVKENQIKCNFSRTPLMRTPTGNKKKIVWISGVGIQFSSILLIILMKYCAFGILSQSWVTLMQQVCLLISMFSLGIRFSLS